MQGPEHQIYLSIYDVYAVLIPILILLTFLPSFKYLAYAAYIGMVFLVVAMVVSYCLCLSVHLSVCLYVHLCTCNGWGREDQLESVTYVHMYMCTVLSTVSLHVVLCVYESDAYDGVPIWYVWYYMYVHDWMADYPSCVCLCCVMTHLPMYIVHSTSHVLNISLLTLLCIDCLCVWHWATLPRCGSWHQLL